MLLRSNASWDSSEKPGEWFGDQVLELGASQSDVGPEAGQIDRHHGRGFR